MQQSEMRARQRGHSTEKSGSHLCATANHSSNEMSEVENLAQSDMPEIQSQLVGDLRTY